MADSDDRVAKMAGDLAEHLGQHIERTAMGGWVTTDEADEFVIKHVQRLAPGEQRRMRAIATALLGLTASGLARAGTAPWEQEVVTDNDQMGTMRIEIERPEGHTDDR